MRRSIFGYFFLAVVVTSTGLASSVAKSEEGLAIRKARAAKDCHDYDRLMARNRWLPTANICDTISPELGGLRGLMYDQGLLYFATVLATGSVDLFHASAATPQAYTGQRPTGSVGLTHWLTYDLSRVGLGDSQFVVSGSTTASNYIASSLDGGWFNRLTIDHQFFNGRVSVMYGFSRLSDTFHGNVLGLSSSSSATGPQGSMMVELGNQASQSAAPTFDINVKSADLRYYNHFGVARSLSPDGIVADYKYNPIGLNVTGVPGAGALLIDEIGYRRAASRSEMTLWLRAGAIYNTSDYFSYATNARSSGNMGFYAIADAQLSQANPAMAPARGLYGQIAFETSPADKNFLNQSVSASLYYIGLSDARPFDSIVLGYLHQWVSADYSSYMMRTKGLQAVSALDSISINYTAQLFRGVYWSNQLQYTLQPVVAPSYPSAFILTTQLRLAL